MGARRQDFLAKIKDSYVFTGITLLSVVLLLAFSNFVAGLFVKAPPAASNESAAAQKRQREATVDQFIQRHGIATLRNAYPGMSDEAIHQLLIATGIVGNRYYPYVEFIQAPYVAPDMLSTPEGYRIIGQDQASWPPPKTGKTVFVFGGSTTLGSGVMNQQTIQPICRDGCGRISATTSTSTILVRVPTTRRKKSCFSSIGYARE